MSRFTDFPSFHMQMASQLRSQQILSNVPLIVTLIDPTGYVVFQNELSHRCGFRVWGLRLGLARGERVAMRGIAGMTTMLELFS